MKPLHPLSIDRYYNAQETAKPGYLARKFERIRREQEAAKAKQAEVVRPINRKDAKS